jgi:hypothetical protein
MLADVSSVLDRAVSRGRDLRVLDGHVVPQGPRNFQPSFRFSMTASAVSRPRILSALANASRRLAACPVLDDPIYIL